MEEKKIYRKIKAKVKKSGGSDNLDLKFDMQMESYGDDSTERYCQSPTADNKGTFSYQELMHTPSRDQHSTINKFTPSSQQYSGSDETKQFKRQRRQQELRKGEG